MLNGSCVAVRFEYADPPEVETMYDALDIRPLPRRRADSPAAARARRPGARRRFPREAFDDWDSSRHRALAPA